MIQLTAIELTKLKPLFEKWSDTSIQSCLEGFMGTAWVDCREIPKSAQILVGDFAYLAGQENHAMVKHITGSNDNGFCIAVPGHEKWAAMIEEYYGEHAKRISRYSTKKDPCVFDWDKLEHMATIDLAYELKLFNKNIFKQAKSRDWAKDLCSQFADYGTYERYALGVAALYKGELVAGASPYTVCRGKIEIEVDTRKDYRRKGLARACSARLILECLKRGIYPSWDAHNKASLALAQQLGYVFDKEYSAYEIVGG